MKFVEFCRTLLFSENKITYLSFVQIKSFLTVIEVDISYQI